MATLKGKGICWGVGTDLTAGVILSTAGYRQSADFNYTATKAKLQDQEGETVGLAYHDLEKTVTVTVLPYGTTKALAATAAGTIVVPPGTAVTVANANCSDVAGAYVAEACRVRETNTGAMLIELDLYQVAGIAAYGDIS